MVSGLRGVGWRPSSVGLSVVSEAGVIDGQYSFRTQGKISNKISIWIRLLIV